YPINLNNNNYFYALKNEVGQLTFYRVNWRYKTTGKLWWQKKRQIARIPEEAFDLYKIFTTNPAPCNRCNANFGAPTLDSILISSGFVNSNYQIKKVLFSKNTFKVRVPKQYVNPNIQYYLKMKKVEWKSKT